MGAAEAFGKEMRRLRKVANDPQRGGPLTQARLAELLGEFSGLSVTPIAISVAGRMDNVL